MDSFEQIEDVTEMENELEILQEAEELEIDSDTEPKASSEEKAAAPEKTSEPRLINLPLSRVKAIMKLDPELNVASAETIFAVTKLTELFIESLAQESLVHTMAMKKRTIQKRDVDMAISSIDSLMFLDGSVNF